MDDQEYMQQMADEAFDTVDMLSSHRKGERERRTVAAFLRCLGVEFTPDELISSQSDPPDVIFRDGRFEVMLTLDGGRKMHADWKKKAAHCCSVQSIEALVEPYRPSAPMSWQELMPLIAGELDKKVSRYASKTCTQLDVLLYLNLRRRHLDPTSVVPIAGQLASQGWRSVCILFPPCSCVLSTTSESPAFLCQREGRTSQECQNWCGMFDL